MDDPKYKHVDASSLVDLRAELFKKQEALKQAKLNQCYEPIKRKGTKLKGPEVPKKVKNVTKSSPSPTTKISEEEEKQLQKSKLSLERKAKLYDQILAQKMSLDDDDCETYMVDFRKKIINHSDIATSESMPEKKEEEEIKTDSTPAINPYTDFFVKANKNTENINSQKQESTADTESSIHYQNVQFNEVRDHGVGYFKFSEDETQRKEQMDLLHTLRQKTEQRKAAFKTSEEKRKSALQARLAKICERRNIDKSALDSLIPKTEVNNSKEEQVSNIDIDNIPLPESNSFSDEPNKPIKTRPWDKGKVLINSEVIIEKRNKVNKRSYFDDRRSERNDEFAPPSFY